MKVLATGQTKIGTGNTCYTLPVTSNQRVAAVSWTHQWSAFGLVTVDMTGPNGKPNPSTAMVHTVNFPLGPQGTFG